MDTPRRDRPHEDLFLLDADGHRTHCVGFDGGQLLVGRAPNSDVLLDLPDVSRRHAALYASAGGVYVHDLGSTAGTRVNGVPISAPRLLHPGDVVACASGSFEYGGTGCRRPGSSDVPGSSGRAGPDRCALRRGGPGRGNDQQCRREPAQHVHHAGVAGAGEHPTRRRHHEIQGTLDHHHRVRPVRRGLLDLRGGHPPVHHRHQHLVECRRAASGDDSVWRRAVRGALGSPGMGGSSPRRDPDGGRHGAARHRLGQAETPRP
ncbi:FHA domain-containing protein [Micrococcaceae bacterium RIT802]|nr:FHA domain-containing protein [Micrococcaceae bacterium RIT 802]